MNPNTLVALVQDRYLYAPASGWCLAMGAGIVEVVAVSPRARRLVIGTVAMLLVAYAGAAFHAESNWHDPVEFDRRSAMMNPIELSFTIKLADLCDSQGGFDAALKIWRDAIPKMAKSEQPLARRLFWEFLMMHGRRGRAGAIAEFRNEHPQLNVTMPQYGDLPCK